jgi:hypothetical protein
MLYQGPKCSPYCVKTLISSKAIHCACHDQCFDGFRMRFKISSVEMILRKGSEMKDIRPEGELDQLRVAPCSNNFVMPSFPYCRVGNTRSIDRIGLTISTVASRTQVLSVTVRTGYCPGCSRILYRCSQVGQLNQVQTSQHDSPLA